MSAHASLVQACVAYLQINGIRAYAVNQVAHHRKDGSYRNLGAPSGLPDIIACLPPKGRLLAIECKTGKSRLRDDQDRVLTELQKAGAIATVVNSIDDLRNYIP